MKEITMIPEHGPPNYQVRLPICRCITECMKGKCECKELKTKVRTKMCASFQLCNPSTEDPLADIWDVNHWIVLRRQKRFAEMFGEENTSKVVPSATQVSLLCAFKSSDKVFKDIDGLSIFNMFLKQGFEPATKPGPSVLAGKGTVGFV